MYSTIFVVMGVSGCGKSTVGAQLAAALGLDFLEGDSLHPAHNVARMAAGFALSDSDREGWLQTLAGRIRLQGPGFDLALEADSVFVMNPGVGYRKCWDRDAQQLMLKIPRRRLEWLYRPR